MAPSAAQFFELQQRRKQFSVGLTKPDGGDGFPSSSDIAAGCVGLAHGRLVCGPPSEHVLQLLPPLPLDLSPGLPLLAVHGEHSLKTG